MAGGIEWHVVEAGDLGAPVILFVHGVPESWYDWHRQMTALAADYHVIAFDLKGFGRSSHPDADAPVGSGVYSAARVAGEVALLMDALGLNKGVTLVSHDWGTLISDHLMSREASRFQAWARMSAPVNGDGQQTLELNPQFTQFQNFDFCTTVFARAEFIFQLYGYNGTLGINSSQLIPNEVVERINTEWRYDPLTPGTGASATPRMRF